MKPIFWAVQLVQCQNSSYLLGVAQKPSQYASLENWRLHPHQPKVTSVHAHSLHAYKAQMR